MDRRMRASKGLVAALLLMGMVCCAASGSIFGSAFSPAKKTLSAALTTQSKIISKKHSQAGNALRLKGGGFFGLGTKKPEDKLEEASAPLDPGLVKPMTYGKEGDVPVNSMTLRTASFSVRACHPWLHSRVSCEGGLRAAWLRRACE